MKTKPFGITAGGEPVDQFTLSNHQGAVVDLINYGATITRVIVPDKNGNLQDIVLGFDDLAGYEKDSPYFGCTVGRVANRIAKGAYTVDGKNYQTAINNGSNSLHGGLRGYDKRIWTVEEIASSDGTSLKFSLTDPDGAEGFPGTVEVSVIFTLTNTSTIRIDYTATTDQTTPINLTNHSYWNLKDGGKSGIGSHILKLYANAYTPVDETQIPTGEVAPVAGTPIDFTTAKPIGQDMQSMTGNPAGYDHNLVLNSQDGTLAKAAEIYEPQTGRWMEVWTTEPGMQFYSGNFLSGAFKGKDGVAYARQSGFAFEAQKFPDAVNQHHFPTCLLKPGEIYRQVTEYRLGASAESPVR